MKSLSLLSVLSMSILLTACFGGGGSGKDDAGYDTDGVISAKFIDDEVKGLSVYRHLMDSTVVTGNNGSFQCADGEELTFSIAGLELGNGVCGSTIFISSLNNGAGDDWKIAAMILQNLSSTAPGSDLDVSAYTNDSTLFAGVASITDVANINAAIASAPEYRAISKDNAAENALEVQAEATGLLGLKLLGKIFKSDDAYNDIIVVGQEFYGSNLFLGGVSMIDDGNGNEVASGCEETIIFSKNGTMTIAPLDSSYLAACEAASQANSSSAYSPLSSDFEIDEVTGRLTVDGIEYCEIATADKNSPCL